MSLVLAGNTSGSTTIQPTDAVTATITLPSATDTLVGKATTDTLTNKTLTLPVVGTTIGVGNATPSASGAGITFPATQSASTDANTLDDYEEGTWTPNQGAGLTVVGAFSSTGTYTKVGRVVTVCFRVGGATSIALTAQGVVCTNLPFTNLNSSNVFGYGTGSNNAGSISTTFQAATTTVYGTTAISATSFIFVSITYFTT